MKLTDTAKRMMLVFCISLPILIICGILYYLYNRSFTLLHFIYGAFLGTVTNIIRTIMLDRTVQRILTFGPEKASNYVRIQYLLRFLITGLALILAALVPFINLWATVIGILVYQIAIYFTKRSIARDTNTNQTTKGDCG